MKLIIILESGELITQNIKENDISKQDLFTEYLDGYYDMEDWYITYNGVRQPIQDFYSNEDYALDDEYEDFDLKGGE